MTSPPTPLEVVVCRYKEDPSWTEPWAAYRTVYNKGDDDLPFPSLVTPNEGREGETYLRHIVRRHPNFAPLTVFCQGRIDDHCHMPSVRALLDRALSSSAAAATSYSGLSTLWGVIVDGQDSHGHPGAELWGEVFGSPPPPGARFPVNYNGIFAVSREALLARPRAFYEALLAAIERRGSLGGYALERLWTPLFTHLPTGPSSPV